MDVPSRLVCQHTQDEDDETEKPTDVFDEHDNVNTLMHTMHNMSNTAHMLFHSSSLPVATCFFQSSLVVS